MLTGLKMSSLVYKCVFTEQNKMQRGGELNFEGLEIQK